MKHKLSITEAGRLLLQHFDLDAPVTKTELERAYRITAIRLHPDMNETDTTTQFQEMLNLYEKLQGCTGLFTEKSERLLDQTTDGTLLTELGQGLGPTVNGIGCTECHGVGYTLGYGRRWTLCNQCDDEGWQLIQCPQCRGTKGFTSIDGKSHVVCGTCKDVGKVRAPALKKRWAHHRSYDLFRGIFGDDNRKPWCHECGGSKRRPTDDREHPIFHKCYTCKGVGEIRIFNPVFPKGRLG